MKILNEQIERLRELIRKCYGVVASKNGIVPEVGERNMENLPTAIASMPLGMYDQLEEVGWTKEQIQDLKDEANLEATKLSMTSTSLTQEEKDKVVFAMGCDKPTNLRDYLRYFRNIEFIPPIDCSNLANNTNHVNAFYGASLTGKRLLDIYLYGFNRHRSESGDGEYFFRYAFYDCKNVQTITMLGHLGWTFGNTDFYGCPNLKTVMLGDCSDSILGDIFRRPTSIENLSVEKLPDADMFTAFNTLSKLTHDSVMNLINALPISTSEHTLTLGATNLAKLTDEEKAIAIDKGWTLN